MLNSGKLYPLFFALCIVCLSFGTASAVTVTASPTTAQPGQTITATTTAAFTSGFIGPSCTLQINFGDSAGWQNTSPVCTNNCSRTLTHSYSTTGVYLIQTRGAGTCPFLGTATDTTQVNISYTASQQEINLPDGMMGMEYKYELGDRRCHYRITRGRSVQGLKILQNQLTGIPEREGIYHFQVSVTDAQGTNFETWYKLRISKSHLTVTTTPQKTTLNRNRSGAIRLTYHFKSSEPLNDTLTSTKGIFSVGSKQIGTVNTLISTQMTKGTGQLVEQVVIPLSVVKNAQRMGADTIQYQREFTPKYMDAATTSSTAITLGTGFSITRIRITFSNHTSKKFVKRNEKIDGAMVEMRYEGAGLLKGYWQVDDRILARVTKTLPFANARTLTLKLPKVPALPTHSIGSHRLRFVVTSPTMNVAFPQVIYIVTGEDLATRYPIHLISPENNTTIGIDELTFSWERRRDVKLYQLEVMQKKGDNQKVIFSAFSKKTTYTMPSKLSLKKLQSNANYFWRVTGLNQDNKPIARSKPAHFTLGSASQVSVPDRLLMLLNGQSETKNNIVLDSLSKKYNLTLVDRKALPQLDRELVYFSTKQDVEKVSRRMQTENQEILVQPDYYYSTLGEIAEQQNLETLCKFFHLKIAATGKGVRIAIIDTGVDLGSRDLAGRIIGHANFINGSSYHSEIHGTAVAGIIGALVNGKDNAGIAPDSKLLALRACEQQRPGKAAGRCYTSSILQAIDKAMADKATIANMSIGTSAPDNLVSTALDLAAETGMILVAPAGNDPNLKKPTFPASHPKVISVAGVLENGKKIPNTLVAGQSDCVLPAQYILATLPGNKVSFMHGTSMATAEVTGLLASLQPDTALLASCKSGNQLIACLSR